MKRRLLVTSGTGPEEVRRFVALLAARLEGLCIAAGLLLLRREVRGAPAAPRSVALVIDGEGSEGLAAEIGTHALVCRSPRRGAASRKRWFARVALAEELEVGVVVVARSDVAVRACRAGGPGGQNVNKRSTAVRATHRPTGLSVRADDERSQRDNRRLAERRLTDALTRRAVAARASTEAAERLLHHRLQRGEPVRTYRLDARGALVLAGGSS